MSHSTPVHNTLPSHLVSVTLCVQLKVDTVLHRLLQMFNLTVSPLGFSRSLSNLGVPLKGGIDTSSKSMKTEMAAIARAMRIRCQS